jgi:hypothetical protein
VSPTEYQQLVEFLGQQFTAVDRRFTGLETRLDDLRREMLRRSSSRTSPS